MDIIKSHIDYSIIIPHRGDTALLKRCLASIPERDDIEVIVVDDGSTSTPTAELAREFNGSVGVTVLRTTHNRGAGHARNVGMRAASGTWLVFGDSDDEFLTGELSSEMDRWINAVEDIVYFDVDRAHADGKTPIPEHHWSRHCMNSAKRHGDKDFIRYQHTTPWGKFIRRRLIEKHAISFQEVPCCNDTRFSMNSALAAERVAFSHAKIYRYIIRNDSLTQLEDLESCLCRFHVQRSYETTLIRRRLGKYRPKAVEAMWLRVFRKDRIRALRLVPSLVASIGVRAFFSFSYTKCKRRILGLYLRFGLLGRHLLDAIPFKRDTRLDDSL